MKTTTNKFLAALAAIAVLAVCFVMFAGAAVNVQDITFIKKENTAFGKENICIDLTDYAIVGIKQSTYLLVWTAESQDASTQEAIIAAMKQADSSIAQSVENVEFYNGAGVFAKPDWVKGGSFGRYETIQENGVWYLKVNSSDKVSHFLLGQKPASTTTTTTTTTEPTTTTTTEPTTTTTTESTTTTTTEPTTTTTTEPTTTTTTESTTTTTTESTTTTTTEPTTTTTTEPTTTTTSKPTTTTTTEPTTTTTTEPTTTTTTEPTTTTTTEPTTTTTTEPTTSEPVSTTTTDIEEIIEDEDPPLVDLPDSQSPQTGYQLPLALLGIIALSTTTICVLNHKKEN